MISKIGENNMKRLLLLITVATFCTGCIFSARTIALNTSDVITAVQNFDNVKGIIERHKDDFTPLEWEQFIQGREGFQVIVNDIKKSDVVTLNQIIAGTEALRDIYISMEGIIDDNKDKLTPAEWYELRTFDMCLHHIADSAKELKTTPDIDKEIQLANTFLEIISVALKIAPMVL